MNPVSEHSNGTQSSDQPTARPLPALNFGDPEAVRAWLARVETVADDGIAAGEDQILPPARRRLGRAVARGLVADARAALAALIDAARRSLPPVSAK